MSILHKTRKARGAVLAAVFFLAAGFVAAQEQAVNRTVQAGVFNFEGYHSKDAQGNLYGYGIEFLELVSEYSHLNFEYVGYDKSWEQMLAMLESGEIDMVTSARKTAERENSFAFSLPIGRNNTVLSVKSDNTRLYGGDYRTYDGMTVGVIDGSSQNDILVDFARSHGFSYKTRKYDDSQKLAADLQNGTIDAILSSNLRKTTDEKTLDTLSSENFYAIVRKDDNALLDEINYAIIQMDISEDDWQNSLFYKYYGAVHSIDLVFNEREKAYIQDVVSGKKVITATAIGDRKPYSYAESGELKGMMIDYFAEIMSLAGLPYTLITPCSRAAYYALADNGVDVVIDRKTDKSAAASKYRGFTTDAYMNTGVARVTRKDFKGIPATVAVADSQGDELIDSLIVEQLSEGTKILNYATREDAMKAVADGKADATYVYTYMAQLFVNNDITDTLHYSIINARRFEFSLYVRNTSDHELATILNKCVRQMPEDALNQLIAKYTAYTPSSMTFVQYLRINPQVLIIIVVSFVLTVAVILSLLLKAKWNRQVLDATQRANKTLAEQFAIVNTLSRDFLNIYSIDVDNDTAQIIKLEGYVTTGLQKGSKEQFPYTPLMHRYVEERVHPDDKAYLLDALSLATVAEKLAEDSEYTGSYRVLIGREEHIFQFSYSKVESPDHENEHFVLVGFRNIDELVRKEQEQNKMLAEALAEAQYANHAKTTFLNNMSHDIRTPMNAIIGFTSLAATHIDSKETVQNYLSKIITSSNHLLSLINDVLDMSRIESGKVKIEEKEANLPEIMHDLKTIVQADVKAKQLEFYIDTLDVTNENIICDKLRLNQVLLNILSNAMKYTKSGGMVSVRVIQLPGAPEGYASYQFIVKDTGIGMSAEFQKHLFEPFEREQTATVSGIQGTGLGLAITKNIVDMMNGTINVKSEPGKGTEFSVSFQFRISGTEAKVERLEELADLHALVVDDDVNTCTSLSKMLSSIGMRPDWTTHGKEAVVRTEFAIEQKDPYSVYIIDWLLPDMNGIEIVRQIRRVIGNETPIIILTAYDWADIEQEAREAGVTAFCSKPIFLSELREVLLSPFRVQEAEPEAEKPAEFLAGKKILLVDDIELNQEIAKTILEEEGAIIDTAYNGAEAVDAVKNAPAGTYDLVLMDVQMPVMDGYEATQHIRELEDREKAAVPIVAMTANAFDEDRQKARDAGMNGHIAKPIDIPQLMNVLKEILE